MEDRYVYRGQDITVDVFMKIEKTIRLIAEREERGFDACYCDFLSSKTYEVLLDTESLLWAESSEFLRDEYFRERNVSVQP